MYIHKKILHYLLIISTVILIGCATSYAPDNFLPQTTDVPQDIYGGWLTVITAPDTLHPDENWKQYSGEFIASEDSNIYLLYDSLYQIPKRNIIESTLELDEKNTTTYGLWVFGGSVLTLSNGIYAGITLPLWLLAGIPTVVGESSRDRYETDESTEEYWNGIKMFARFPQGISNIDLASIKPILKYKE
ncbi:MAG TPA: hypothetical protein VLH59_11885 [Ignavibacteriaceae bacterium]|nr:hypothetical protein [Ignavibacteriaceae bacterium]